MLYFEEPHKTLTVSVHQIRVGCIYQHSAENQRKDAISLVRPMSLESWHMSVDAKMIEFERKRRIPVYENS